MRRIKSFLIIICMLSIYAASFYGCGKKEWSDSHNNEAGLPEIVIGSDNYPPYNYVDIDWEDKKNLLADRTIDCAWGSFSMDGRENEYRWAGPYMTSRQVVAVDMGSDIYSLEDLEGKTIAVQTTTRPEKIFLNKTDERIPAIRSLIALQKRELIYPFLSKGYADALAAHETAIRQYMEDYNIKFRILETVGLGVAFDKNDDRGIEKQLTEILNQMRNDGTEKKIISRYIPDADKYLEVDSYGK